MNHSHLESKSVSVCAIPSKGCKKLKHETIYNSPQNRYVEAIECFSFSISKIHSPTIAMNSTEYPYYNWSLLQKTMNQRNTLHCRTSLPSWSISYIFETVSFTSANKSSPSLRSGPGDGGSRSTGAVVTSETVVLLYWREGFYFLKENRHQR